MTTIKRWLTSPWFKDAAERVVRAFIAGFLAVTGLNQTSILSVSELHAAAIGGCVAAISAVLSILATFRTAPSATPASLVKEASTVDPPGTYVAKHRKLPESTPGRLGRHVNHDSRSLNFLVEADGTVATVRWDRVIPVLNQGQVGSCTGNAATGALGTLPDYPVLPKGTTLNEAMALKLYSAAEVIDGNGPYPPNDDGSSGLSVAKAAKNAGLISGYTHITSLAAAKTAIQTGPFIVGSNWYTGMDTPDSTGLVTATGTVRGGHEYECIGYDVATDLWEFVNSWGTTYGVAGHFFYSSATFTTLLSEQGDATVLLPLTAPAPTPTPTPSDADAVLQPAAAKWVKTNHTGSNGTMAAALKVWLAAQ